MSTASKRRALHQLNDAVDHLRYAGTELALDPATEGLTVDLAKLRTGLRKLAAKVGENLREGLNAKP